MRQVTKSHSHHLLGVLGYMSCVDRGPSQFCEMYSMVTNFVTDPLRYFVSLCGRLVNIESEF